MSNTVYDVHSSCSNVAQRDEEEEGLVVGDEEAGVAGDLPGEANPSHPYESAKLSAACVNHHHSLTECTVLEAASQVNTPTRFDMGSCFSLDHSTNRACW
jgi:hypothetical protein